MEAEAKQTWEWENKNEIRKQIERENPPDDDFDDCWDYERKIDRLCEAHPDYNKISPRWESLTKAYPSYAKVSEWLLKLRFKQAAVHLAVAEKVC